MLQTDGENSSAVEPEIPVQTESEQSKSRRGGKRPGAGRKPNLVKRLLKGVHQDTVAVAVRDIDVAGVISQLLKSRREVVRLQTLNFVFDRLLGKPKQELGVTGGMVHAHVRDPLLATLPRETLDALATAYDAIVTKHALPSPDAAQDGPQNQIESNTEPCFPDDATTRSSPI
jgi:hypothetical protein